MRVGNPSNIPLPSAFIYSFLPALVRILWIVVVSVVASLSTFSTTAMVPVSCHPTIDHDYARRRLLLYCIFTP
jgi:hypothetical protein